jgi:hypothetical protein
MELAGMIAFASDGGLDHRLVVFTFTIVILHWPLRFIHFNEVMR